MTVSPAPAAPGLSESRPGARAWLTVGLLWAAAPIWYADRILFTTIHGSLLHAIPMSEKQYGLLTSVFFWVYALVGPFAGFLADRFSRSRVIIFSMFTWSVLTWLTGRCTTFGELLVARALMGITEASYLPTAFALIADYHRGQTRSLATGIHSTGIRLGTALGGVAGWLAERYGWSFPFSFYGIAGVAYSIAMLFLLRDAPVPAAESTVVPRSGIRFGAAIVSLFATGACILLFLFYALRGISDLASIGWTPVYFQERFHLSQGAAGITTTFYFVVPSILGFLAAGAWADRWSRTNQRGRIYVAAIGVFLSIPAFLITYNTGVLTLAVVGLILSSFVRSFVDPNMMPILCQVCDPRYRATGYAFLNTMGALVGGLSIFLTGAFRDQHVSMGMIFNCAIAPLVVCTVLMLLVKPKGSGA